MCSFSSTPLSWALTMTFNVAGVVYIAVAAARAAAGTLS